MARTVYLVASLISCLSIGEVSAQSFVDAASFFLFGQEDLPSFQGSQSRALNDRVSTGKIENQRALSLVSEVSKCQLRVSQLNLNDDIEYSGSSFNASPILGVGHSARIVDLDFNEIDLKPKLDVYDSGQAALTFSVSPRFCRVLSPKTFAPFEEKLVEVFRNYAPVRPDNPKQRFWVEYFLTPKEMIFELATAREPSGKPIFPPGTLVLKANAGTVAQNYARANFRSLLSQDVGVVLQKANDRQFDSIECGTNIGLGLDIRGGVLIGAPSNAESVNQRVTQLKRIRDAAAYLRENLACGAAPAPRKAY